MISQTFSATYRELFTTSARYILLWGGRGRGGSHSATDYFAHLLTSPGYFRGYFMRAVFSDIRESLWQDFNDRIESNTTINKAALAFNDTAMSVRSRTTGNLIKSKGFKKGSKQRTAKLKSLAGATHVIIEEAEEITEEEFIQLDDSIRSIRSSIKIILIFNPPPKKHWIWKKWFTLVAAPIKGYFRAIPRSNPQLLSIFSTFQANVANLNPSTVANWLSYKTTNPDHYWTIIMGFVSEGARGRIYKNWQPCQKMPGLYPKFYGLDWGFSGDPLALVEMESHNRTLWGEEKIYERGMTNDDLDKRLTMLGISKRAPIIADSAQPKDIEDMRRKGWNFIACVKGPGSVRSGIKYLQQFSIFVTETSTNLWQENEDYAWALDQNKEPTNEPIDANNHGMDAMNYGADRLRFPSGIAVVKGAGQEVSTGRNEYNA